MEMQLNSLIEKIKKEGIAEARVKSEEIIEQAEQKKTAIIKDAQETAETIVKEAENKAAKLKDNSQKAIAQAVRDVTLSLKEEIKNLFDAILKKEIQHSISDEFIAKLLLRIAENWSKDRKASLEVMVNQKDKKSLEKLMLSKFKSELSSGIIFRVNPNINKGLYIGIKGEEVYYDLTDEAILGILKEYLRPFIVKIIDQVKT